MAKQIIDDTVMENVEILAKLALTEEERKRKNAGNAGLC